MTYVLDFAERHHNFGRRDVCPCGLLYPFMRASQVRMALTAPQRILVVDDHPDIRDLTRDLLASEFPAATVDVATSAEQALEKAIGARDASSPFDLIVTDHQMRKVTGLELLHQLHVEPRPFRTILMSASPEAEQLSREDAAVDAFLRKPFGPDELLEAARLHLRGRLRER